jgi:hypothetical protein
VIKPVILDICD